MAGPRNNYNPKHEEVEVFDAEKNTFTVTRPNARELIATGNYFWSVSDIGKERLESDGPADPAAEVMTVYDKYDVAHEVARANAKDLVANRQYTWVPAHAVTDTPVEPATANVSTEQVVTEEPSADDPLDPVNSPLHKIAERVAGNSDVAAYLEGFPVETLRDMAAQRYGEKIHHRASKENAITKMIELEEAKLVADDAGEASEC